jgi:hypothetical protein
MTGLGAGFRRACRQKTTTITLGIGTNPECVQLAIGQLEPHFHRFAGKFRQISGIAPSYLATRTIHAHRFAIFGGKRGNGAVVFVE